MLPSWCLALSLAVLVLLDGVVAPPVTANKKEDSKDNEVDEEHKNADWDVGLEYNRYLQEVVQALESDPQFREKLEKAEVADIRTGKIASELEFVSHNVRSKLDELKRQELERLRHLAIKQAEIKRMQEFHHEGSDSDDESEDPQHVDHDNPHTFEVEDLKKLIVQTTRDLEEADRKRRQEFKEYEMQKQFEQDVQMNLLDDDHKKELKEKIKQQEEKHKNHPSLHHPGSKPQLEEVWENQDHMNPEDFNPKTFFHLHDLDGNGFWDADEVKALFQKELDKMYDPSAPEDDMKERREEMERMREHVFNETDTNRDMLISYEEFLEQTKKQEFEQDQGWDGLDKQELYTQEEYHEFEKRRQAEIQQMMQQGLLPPAPDLHLPYGMQVPPEYIQQQHQQNLQYQQQHQIPPHAQAQFHPQGGVPMHPGQMGQFQHQSGHQAPPQAYHQPQVQGYHPPPAQQAYQQHPNAIPNQNYQHMPPQGHPQAAGHVPQYQAPPHQVPPHINNPPQQHAYQNQPAQGHDTAVHQQFQQNAQGMHSQNLPPTNQNQQNAQQQVHQNQAPIIQNQQNAQQQLHQNQPPTLHNQQNVQPGGVHQNQQYNAQPSIQHNAPPVQNQAPIQSQPAATSQQNQQYQAPVQQANANINPNAPPVQNNIPQNQAAHQNQVPNSH